MPPDTRVTRFAPSPTGLLHLGHAYAALVAAERSGAGQFLLRIEDIDRTRCRSDYEQQIFEDLRWLGLSWRQPVMRQSDRMEAYHLALQKLAVLGVLYPCRCTRGDIRAALSAPQEGDVRMGPDGVVYPGLCRGRAMSEAGPDDAIRLDMRMALTRARKVSFRETGPLFPGVHSLDYARMLLDVGDVVLSRRGMGTSYHLSVVVDDAAQSVTEVTRGEDLFEATHVHVLLQALLELPSPTYYHHRLIRDRNGKRLAKRDDARALSIYRAKGVTPAEIRIMLDL